MQRLPALACTAFLAVGLGGVLAPDAAQAGRACIHPWAQPGEYVIVGQFQGHRQSTIAWLTNNCRVYIDFPGVFTGGPVTKAGKCVAFGFRVQGAPEVFAAQWCGQYALVPLEGETIRADVYKAGQ